MRRFILLLLLLLYLTSGCATLPDYAQPQLSIGGDGNKWSELIPYRDLAVTDFKATSLSGALKGHSYKLQAHTRVVVRVSEDTELSIYSTQAFNKILYRGGVQTLLFEALMIPEESWWSPTIHPKKADYVLQHEQIHFAIMEKLTQKMNREVKEDSSRFVCYGETKQEVKAQLGQKISDYITENLTVVLAEHTAFDKETSLQYNPETQQHWYDKVAAQLSRNEAL